MWKNFQDILHWFRGEDDAYTPADAPIAGLIRLVALSAMASISELRQRQAEESAATPASDEGLAPGQAAAASPGEPKR